MKYTFLTDKVKYRNGESTKMKVMNLVVCDNFNAKRCKIERRENKYSLLYKITNDGNKILLKFPSEFREDNIEFIEFLDKKVELENKKSRHKIYIGAGLLTLLISTIGAIAYSEKISLIKKSIYDNYKISTLEREIEIHSGNNEANPYYGHGCAIGSRGTVSGRIEEYCKENGLDKIIEPALEKYEKAFKDDKSYKEIDLQKIYSK